MTQGREKNPERLNSYPQRDVRRYCSHKKNRTSCTEKKKEGKSIKEFLEIKNYGPNKKFNKRAGEASGRNVRTESKESMSLI